MECHPRRASECSLLWLWTAYGHRTLKAGGERPGTALRGGLLGKIISRLNKISCWRAGLLDDPQRDPQRKRGVIKNSLLYQLATEVRRSS
jgi:hypothetical protein